MEQFLTRAWPEDSPLSLKLESVKLFADGTTVSLNYKKVRKLSLHAHRITDMVQMVLEMSFLQTQR